jgi:hypothetical protein
MRFERGVPTGEVQTVDKAKGAGAASATLSHNDIAEQLESLDKLALVEEEDQDNIQ